MAARTTHDIYTNSSTYKVFELIQWHNGTCLVRYNGRPWPSARTTSFARALDWVRSTSGAEITQIKSYA